MEERISSIQSQKFKDWEVVGVDGYSDDGTWEALQVWASGDSRVRLFRAPREGIYAGINACISEARGEFIYIATADDTMSSDCLEKMEHALRNHHECSIAHTGLVIINEVGQPVPENDQWRHYRVAKYFGAWMNIAHIRKAPLDGLLHTGLCSVYVSLTQLLVRRKVFDTIGLFRTDLGSEADFEWDMRAAMVYDTVHVPGELATWRRHKQQATQHGESSDSRLRMRNMCLAAFQGVKNQIPKFCARKMEIRRWTLPYLLEYVRLGLRERHSRVARWSFLVYAFLRFPGAVMFYVMLRMRGREPNSYWGVDYMRQRVQATGLGRNIQEISLIKLTGKGICE